MLGSIKGQDFTKAGLILCIVAGVVFEILGFHGLKAFFTIR
jgi:hypothetical protein